MEASFRSPQDGPQPQRSSQSFRPAQLSKKKLYNYSAHVSVCSLGCDTDRSTNSTQAVKNQSPGLSPSSRNPHLSTGTRFEVLLPRHRPFCNDLRPKCGTVESLPKDAKCIPRYCDGHVSVYLFFTKLCINLHLQLRDDQRPVGIVLLLVQANGRMCIPSITAQFMPPVFNIVCV